jgi:DNA-binding transcriptional regulator YiaG
MTRGACSDALAEEVHRRTTAGMMTRFASGRHRQTIDDAVGQAFMVWLAGSADKTLHTAGEHVHWLIKLATDYMLGKSRRKGSRHVRPCASWAMDDEAGQYTGGFALELEASKHESIWREFAGVSSPGDHEDHFLADLDLMHRIMDGRECKTWHEALDLLIARGWTGPQIAVAVGASEQAVLTWRNGARPHEVARDNLLELAAIDGPPPPPVTCVEARRIHATRRTMARYQRPPAPRTSAAVESVILGAIKDDAEVRAIKAQLAASGSWSDAMAMLIKLGWTRAQVSRKVGVSAAAVRTWASGRGNPAAQHHGAIVALAREGKPPPVEPSKSQVMRAHYAIRPRPPRSGQKPQQNAAPRPSVDFSQEPVAAA